MIQRRGFFATLAAFAAMVCRDWKEQSYFYDWTTNPVTTNCPNPLALRRGRGNNLICNGQDVSDRFAAITRAKCGPNGWFEILRIDLFDQAMDEIPRQVFHGNVQVMHDEVS